MRPRFLALAAFFGMATVIAMIVSRQPDQMVVGRAQPIDGDSLSISGREMRIRGIDAPEFRQTCTIGGREEACGRQSATALRNWLARGPLTCIGNETDRFGRLLVTCRVNGTDIGADLVRNGHAVDYGLYPAEEREAVAGHRGIWAGTFERPEAWRRRHREPQNKAAP